jgi:hypothetical protein
MTGIRILAATGAAVAISSVMLLLYLGAANSPGSGNPPGSPSAKELDEMFKRAENTQEVQLFMAKYSDVLKGFSQSPRQIVYNYTASKWVDLDGNGDRETFRQLTISVVFDKNPGDGSEPEKVIATCSTASEADRRLQILGKPVYGGSGVLKHLQQSSSWCIPQ